MVSVVIEGAVGGFYFLFLKMPKLAVGGITCSGGRWYAVAV